MKRINEDHRISRPSKYIADPSALGSIWIIGLHLDHRAQFELSGSIWIQIPVNKMVSKHHLTFDKDNDTMRPIS